MEVPVKASHITAADAVRTHVFAFTLLPLKAENQPRSDAKFSNEHQNTSLDLNSPLKAAKAGVVPTSSSTNPSAAVQQFLQQLSTARTEALSLLSDASSSAAAVQTAVDRCVLVCSSGHCICDAWDSCACEHASSRQLQGPLLHLGT
jgi:hypothetical protein